MPFAGSRSRFIDERALGRSRGRTLISLAEAASLTDLSSIFEARRQLSSMNWNGIRPNTTYGLTSHPDRSSRQRGQDDYARAICRDLDHDCLGGRWAYWILETDLTPCAKRFVAHGLYLTASLDCGQHFDEKGHHPYLDSKISRKANVCIHCGSLLSEDLTATPIGLTYLPRSKGTMRDETQLLPVFRHLETVCLISDFGPIGKGPGVYRFKYTCSCFIGALLLVV